MPSKRKLLAVVLSCLTLPVWLVACGGGGDTTDEVAAEAVAETATSTPAACSTSTDLPGDISFDLSTATQTDFDEYSWQTFLALAASSVQGTLPTSGDTTPLWSTWSSTVDFIETQGAAFGTHYYPEACQNLSLPEGMTYEDYRPIAQVAKVNDSFDEAGDTSGNSVALDRTQGVGITEPLIASNGTFARYEILLNEVAYDFVNSQGLYQASALANIGSDFQFTAATSQPNGGDPSNANSGSIVLKLAWVDVTGFDDISFHTEDLLVFSDGDITSTGDDICELKTMGLVGMHIARKTTQQPNWTWSTFEHSSNSPTCDGLPPLGSDGTPPVPPNTSCPSTSTQYIFNPGSSVCTGSNCASCNSDPTGNCSSTSGFCVDQAVTSGFSQLCRQVTTGGSPGSGLAAGEGTGYGSDTLNGECENNLGTSVWADFELVSTQWTNSSGSKVPTLPVGPDQNGQGGAQRQYLANVSMESAERSNCFGCHNEANVAKSDNSSTPKTDSMFWLAIEVAAADD